MAQYSIGNRKGHNTPTQRHGDFAEMTGHFISQFETRYDVTDTNVYNDAKGSACYLATGFTDGVRSNATATPRPYIALDCDNSTEEQFNAVLDWLEQENIACLAYLTMGDDRKPGVRKFRVLVEITRPLLNHEIAHYSKCLTDEMPAVNEWDESVYRPQQPLFASFSDSVLLHNVEGLLVDIAEYPACPAPEVPERTAAQNPGGKTEALENAIMDAGGRWSGKGYKLQSLTPERYSTPCTPDDFLILLPEDGFDMVVVRPMHDTDRVLNDSFLMLKAAGHPQVAIEVKKFNRTANRKIPDVPAHEWQKSSKTVGEDGWWWNLETGDFGHPDGLRDIMFAKAHPDEFKVCTEKKRARALEEKEREQKRFQAEGFHLYGEWVTVSEKGKPFIQPAEVIARDISRALSGQLAFSPDRVRDRDGCRGLMRYRDGVWQPFTAVTRHITQAAAAGAIQIVNGKEVKRETFDMSSRLAIEAASTLANMTDYLMGEPRKGAIAFRNGVLDLASRRLEKHAPDNWFIARVEADYVKGAECPVFDAWLEFTADGDPSLAGVIRATLYAIMCGCYRFKKFYEVIGEGNSGKSVFQRLAESLVGNNVMATSFRSLGRDAHAFASLPGRALVVMSDQDGGMYSSGDIKKLTGDDTVEIRPVGGASYHYRTQAPLLVVGNSALAFRETSGAIDKRRVLIPFDRVVPDSKRDLAFSDKLEAELPAIAGQLLDLFTDNSALDVIETWQRTSVKAKEMKAGADLVVDFARTLVPVNSTGRVEDIATKVGNHTEYKDGAARTRNLLPLFLKHYEEATGSRTRITRDTFALKLLTSLADLHPDLKREDPELFRLWKIDNIRYLLWEREVQ